MTTTTHAARELDMGLLEAFIGRMVGDVGATISAGCVFLGDRLGLYRAMADGEPVTAEALADRTGTHVDLRRGRGWPTRRPAGTSSTTPRPTPGP